MGKNLSKRLSACLSALSSHSRIADIGTDHAYLPCYGVANGIIDSAIAIDVVDGPLAQAKATIADYGLEDKVELRKGSGFEPLEEGEVEGVNIAGMGGKLISQLLLDSLSIAESIETLVLQPQGGEFTLRSVLDENYFKVTNEQLIEEDGIIYTIITAEPAVFNNTLVYKELLFGPVLLKNPENELFIKKWQQELGAIDEILSQIPDGDERKFEFERKRKLIEDVLAGVGS